MSDINKTGAQGISFYYPWLLYCLDQMLAKASIQFCYPKLSDFVHHGVPNGLEHTIRMYSTVRSEVPHLQFGGGVRPHLYMDKWNCPTVHKQLSLIQAVQDKLIPKGLALVLGMKT